MFERMMLEPSVTTPDREDVDIDLVWGDLKINFTRNELDSNTRNISLTDYYYKILKLNYDSCEEEEFEFLPENETSFCNVQWCHENFVTLFKKNELSVKQKNNMETTIATVFYVALGVGIIAGVVLMYGFFLLRKKICGKKTKKIPRRDPSGRLARK